MKRLLFRKIFIGTLLTVMFIGELSFQLFTNTERSIVTLDREEQLRLDSILMRQDVSKEKTRAEKRVEPLNAAKATYQELNRRAESSKNLFNPYSSLIVDADRQIDDAWRPYYKLVDELQAPIRREYEQRRKNGAGVLGMLTGIQYGISASMLAVGFAFFSTLRRDNWKWILFCASFVAQFVACTMIWDGAMLKFDSLFRAWAFAIMFFTCAPLALHFGVIHFSQGTVETVTVAFETHPETAVTIAKTTVKHTSITFAFPHTIDGWQSAIEAIVNERKAGNGKNLVSATARYFGVNKGTVSRAVYHALRREPINVPIKLIGKTNQNEFQINSSET